MRRWPFAPVVVFLMTFLNSSCGAQIRGDMTDAKLRRAVQETKREAGPVSPATESLDQNQKVPLMQTGRRPRVTCPPGRALEPRDCGGSSECKCGPCRSEFYSSQDSCVRCKSCYGKYGLKVVKECKLDQDRECGCQDGHFRVGPEDTFTCKRCTRCLNRQTERNCSEKGDAKCLPGCLPGFCQVGDSCRRCPEIAHLSTSLPESHAVPTFAWPQRTKPNRISPEPELCGKVCIFGLCGCLLLLVGVLVVFWKRRRCTRASLAGSANPPRSPGLRVRVTSFETPAPRAETAVLTDPGPAPHCVSLQQGRKLYAVIDAVPVRRWKEFVRGLGLRDGEIELVELEHSQFRERQYEMLKRWGQQKGASMGAIFATLEDMQLGGCAQELREQLQPQNLQRSPEARAESSLARTGGWTPGQLWC